MQLSQGVPVQNLQNQTQIVFYPVSATGHYNHAGGASSHHGNQARMINLLNESYDSLTSSNNLFSTGAGQLDTSLHQAHMNHPLV